jgi:glycosidase
MPTEILGAEVRQALDEVQRRARLGLTREVPVDGRTATIPSPYPSPGDWRDCWIYFLLIDRFDNPARPPKAAWDRTFNFRQGGTFEGVRQRLGYLQDLGVKALWLSPVVKNPRPEQAGFEYSYPGYSAQDFLNLDERFASDGTRATAERELAALVDEAHARGIYVILDVVLNHAGRVFDYLYQGAPASFFADAAVLGGGPEPPVRWIDRSGTARADWQDGLPPPAELSPDDAVWPVDLQRKEFFRRRGGKLSDAPGADGFVRGDFGTLRQLVHEYDAGAPGQEALRASYGPMPVLSILIRAYQYLVARYDFDGFRIDTAKYLRPDLVETFGNAMREYALAIGKSNFFTFGEIYDDEARIAKFVGRSGGDTEGFGIDAALDFPLFFQLPGVIKGWSGVEAVRGVFQRRKEAERGLISSHGEAGRYFVSFLDNHDQHERFNAPGTPAEQVSLGVAVLFALQGIPCLYYGTEQGLQGTNDGAGHPRLDSNESVREALWGKASAFDPASPLYRQIQAIAGLRAAEPALRYGRVYFREVSGNGQDFGQSSGAGGLIAFSRILGDREAVVVANTHFSQPFAGAVLVDFDLSRARQEFSVGYSNRGTAATATVRTSPGRIFEPEGPISIVVASLPVSLAPMEVQILVPASA